MFNMVQGHNVSDEEGRVLQLDFNDLRLINAIFRRAQPAKSGKQ
jgi:hypothetical protein